MTIGVLLSLFERIGTVHVKESMRKDFKTKLEELEARYTEGWDGSSQCYVFMVVEDKLV